MATNAARIAEGESEDSTLLRFGGATFQPLPSGALYWPAERLLVAADLHLEKLASFAPRGQLLPPYDTGLTLARLAADLLRTGAQAVLALGDSFHRDEGLHSLRDADRAALAALTGRARWIWLAGNHDPRPTPSAASAAAMSPSAICSSRTSRAMGRPGSWPGICTPRRASMSTAARCAGPASCMTAGCCCYRPTAPRRAR